MVSLCVNERTVPDLLQNVDNFGKKPKKAKCDRDFIAKFVERLFYKHGLLVGKYPYYFLIIPVLLALLCCLGIFKVKLAYDFYPLFAPTNSPAFQENDIFVNYFNFTGGLFYFVLAFTAKDGGSLLREPYRYQVGELLNYIENNYTVDFSGEQYTFDDIRMNEIENYNKIPLMAIKYFNNTNLRMNYPVVSYVSSQKYYIGEHWRNVTIDTKTDTVTGMSTILFLLLSAKGDEKRYEKLRNWAFTFEHIDYMPGFPDLHICFWNEDFNVEEVYRHVTLATPFVCLGFALLTIFALTVSYSKNPVKSKPWETLTSVFCVIISTGASFGILFLVGYPFTGNMVASPILVLALGMDVTYITLRGWKNTDENSAPNERLAQTLSESGPSIIITSLTNLLSAGLGCISTTPVTFAFCLSVMISVIFLFVLQITTYAAALAIGAQREANNMHSLLCCLKVKQIDEKIAMQELSSKTDKNFISIITDFSTSVTKIDIWKIFCNFLSEIMCFNSFRLVVSIILLLYWALTIYLCTQVTVGLVPEKVIPKNSKLQEMLVLDRETIQPENGIILYVIVMKPPNFLNEKEKDEIYSMVKDFESWPYCLKEATTFWSRDYDSYIDEEQNPIDNTTYNSNLIFYLRYNSEGYRFKDALSFSFDNSRIEKFILSLVYARTRDWSLRRQYTNFTRTIAAKYEKFGVTTWFADNYNFITDQLDFLLSNTVQDLVITAVCMAVICMMFIPNFFSTTCSVLTIFSINIGVFGILTSWGSALDPVSMSSFLIAIGYSVDFTSHISYHYYISEGVTSREKLFSALYTIGLPMLQTGISTLLCVGCMGFVSDYIELVFVKSIFLVISLGLLHGLIVLPMFLAWIPLDFLNKLFSFTVKDIAKIFTKACCRQNKN